MYTLSSKPWRPAMMNKPKTLFFSIITSLILLSSSPSVVHAAPKLSLDPTSLAPIKNQEFSVTLKIDVEANQVIGSDIAINYAGADQEIIGVDNANYFPEFTWANNPVGKLEIHAYTTSTYQAKTGNGVLATIKFRSKKDSGSSTLTFNCTGSGNDTNIVGVNGQNLLSCSNLNQATVTYAGNVAPTPTPTSNPSNIIPVCSGLTADPVVTSGIPKLITFTCHGSDNDSDIYSAEFTFGDDSTSLSVSESIGRKGSISTTHTFTKTGTMNAKCRLRDNSSFSTTCAKTITIKPQPTTSPTAKPKATPSGKILSLIDESTLPSPTPRPTISPTPEAAQLPSIKLWWVFPIIVIIGIIYLLYRYYKTPGSPLE